MDAERKDWDSLPEKCQRLGEVGAVVELVEATLCGFGLEVTSTGSVTDSASVTVGIRLPNG